MDQTCMKRFDGPNTVGVRTVEATPSPKRVNVKAQLPSEPLPIFA